MTYNTIQILKLIRLFERGSIFKARHLRDLNATVIYLKITIIFN